MVRWSEKDIFAIFLPATLQHRVWVHLYRSTIPPVGHIFWSVFCCMQKYSLLSTGILVVPTWIHFYHLRKKLGRELTKTDHFLPSFHADYSGDDVIVDPPLPLLSRLGAWCFRMPLPIHCTMRVHERSGRQCDSRLFECYTWWDFQSTKYNFMAFKCTLVSQHFLFWSSSNNRALWVCETNKTLRWQLSLNLLPLQPNTSHSKVQPSKNFFSLAWWEWRVSRSPWIMS